MKAKPRPLHYPDRSCWCLSENGQYCGCYAERRSFTDGHPYCPRHYALLSRTARGEYDRSILPPVAKDRDGNFVRYPGGSSVEETERIRRAVPQTVKRARNAAPMPRKQGKRRAAQGSLL